MNSAFCPPKAEMRAGKKKENAKCQTQVFHLNPNTYLEFVFENYLLK